LRIASPKFSRDLTPFVGRQYERERLLAELHKGTSLVSLIGPSGIGKTRLARLVAGEFVDSSCGGGGVWFCDLSACRTASDLELTVARTLEIRQQHGEELARSVANRGPLLLILDNADSVAASCAEVLEGWLDRCVELQVIMTSVVPSGATGEVLVELQPLNVNDAVALYLDRAHRAWADRRFYDDGSSEVRELVQRLDRLPLAIELAAARVRILPPRTLLSMLEKRFELLRAPLPKIGASAGLPHTKNSLLSALDFTWSHLEPYEQLAVARAAVFEGGFSIEAASAILSGDDQKPSSEQPHRPLIQVLDDLRKKSLIVQEGPEPPRFLLLESVKSYALQELRRMGLWDETIRRHASFFLSQDEAQAEWVDGPERAASLDWLKQERANLLAVLHRFLHGDPALAARAGISLIPLSRWEGHPSPETDFPQTLLDAATRSANPILLARALSFLAILHFRHGRVDRAIQSFEEAARLAREAEDDVVEAKVYVELALLHTATGDLDQTRQALERAAALSERTSTPSLIAQLRLAQGFAAFQQGDLDEAEDRYMTAVALLPVNGRLGSGAIAHNGLAITLAFSGRFDEARQLHEKGLRISQSLGYRALQAHILDNFAEVDLASGFLDDAEAACRQSLAIHREIGNRFREGRALFILGIISLERGDLDAAGEQLTQADEHFTACGAAESHVEFLLLLAALETKLGRTHEAQQILDEFGASAGSVAPQVDRFAIEVIRALILLTIAQSNRAHDPDGGTSHIQAARALLLRPDSGRPRLPSYLPVFSRLLERELEAWDAGTPSPSRAPQRSLLTTGTGHDWFQIGSSQRVDLRGREVLQKIFTSLVKARVESPGRAIDPYDLVDMVWPGVGMIPGRATKRLYMAMLLLRDLGLRPAILTVENGYLLDPQLPIRVHDDESSSNDMELEAQYDQALKPSFPGRAHENRSTGSRGAG